MIAANNVTLRLGKKALFEDVNIKFTEGNCYGIIGANGAGKSTFLRILSGQLETTSGYVSISQGQRLSFLEQNQNKYDNQVVLDTVIQGNPRLFEIMKEKDALYAKEDFSDEDGIKASELETEFAELNGWEAEADAESLLNGLGIETELHSYLMRELTGAQKVKVLLARALFGNPDILLLDEPTNHLDLDAIAWLEEFLIGFENTVIVVSHDRYFLNKVCTYIADIDYGKITLFAGNYDFWYESSRLLIRQMKEANKKKEEKIKELKEFISRFSANASKSKQATSRKRALEKIQLEEIKPSSRKYPYIDFRPDREIGNEVLTVSGISKTINGVKVLDNVSFVMGHDDKIAFVGSQELAKTTLFEILMGRMEPDEGTYKWGVTTSQAFQERVHDHRMAHRLLPCQGCHLCARIPRENALCRRRRHQETECLFRRRARALPAVQDDDQRRELPDLRRAHEPSGYGVHFRAQRRNDQVPRRRADRLPRPPGRTDYSEPHHRDPARRQHHR